jgi:RNA polymerase sigma factor (sigma-70 family)
MDSRESSLRPDELLAQLGWVRALARSLVADPDVTDDVLQQVCLLALERAPSGARTGPRLRAWLAAVTRSLAGRSARSDARRRRREQLAAQPEALPSTETVATHREVLRQLVDAVTSLEEPYYSVVVAHYFDGRSVSAIASMARVSPAAVRQRLTRARQQLRERLEALLDDDQYGWLRAALPVVTTAGPAPVVVPLAASSAPPPLVSFGGFLVAKSLAVVATAIGVGLVITATIIAVRTTELPGGQEPVVTAAPTGERSLETPLTAPRTSEPEPLAPLTEPVAVAPQPPAQGDPGTPAIEWPQTFAVVVVDGQARPVADARVELWSIVKKPELGHPGAVESELARSGVTDGIGRGVVRLEDKDQFVVALKDGVGRSARLTHHHLKRQLNGDGQSVITLKPDVIVDGRVLRADGVPAHGIAVEVAGTRAVMTGDRHVERAVTGPDGSFRIACLPTRDLEVAAIADDGTRIEQRFDVPEDRHLSVTLHLPGEWWIDGTVVDSSGVAVPSARVVVLHGSAIADAWLNQPAGSAEPERNDIRSGSDGSFRYRVTALEPHVLIALTRRPPAISDPVLVPLDEARTSATATLQFVAPAGISGHVRDPRGEPLANALVAARVVGPPLLKLIQPNPASFLQSPGVHAQALADTAGAFVLSPLHPQGVFDILLSPPGGRIFGSAMLLARQDVPAGSSGLNLVAQFTGEQTRTGAIHLQAYAAATGLPVEVRVYSYALEGKVAGFEAGAERANGGVVRVLNLVPGSAYTVALSVEGMGTVDVHDLVASETPELVRVAVPALGQLEVEANDAHGLPLPLVEVTVRRTYEPIGFHHPSPVFTDAQGRARFAGLDPGRFRVSFSVDGVETESFIDVGDGASEFLRVTASAGD